MKRTAQDYTTNKPITKVIRARQAAKLLSDDKREEATKRIDSKGIFCR